MAGAIFRIVYPAHVATGASVDDGRDPDAASPEDRASANERMAALNAEYRDWLERQ